MPSHKVLVWSVSPGCNKDDTADSHTQGNFGWCPPGVLFYCQENKFITAASLQLLHVKFALFLDCKVGLDPCRGENVEKAQSQNVKLFSVFFLFKTTSGLQTAGGAVKPAGVLPTAVPRSMMQSGQWSGPSPREAPQRETTFRNVAKNINPRF